MAAFKKVLIIDDDSIFLQLCEIIMEDEQFATEILKFTDANRALKYLNSIKNTEIPEVVLLDINMPVMDGWEFMDAIAGSSMVNKMTIYITSSSIDPKDLKKAEQNPDIKSFITKPINPEKLKKIETAYRR